ncbi:GntR family transcriptional regulator [Streptomyces sp. J2-1]|nr:GntR family transcriptional regulator [Streptomyces corallincola]
MSRNSVREALDALRARGFVETRHGFGVVRAVRRREPPTSPPRAGRPGPPSPPRAVPHPGEPVGRPVGRSIAA